MTNNSSDLLEASPGWKAQITTRAKWLFNECMQSCAHLVFDIADLVRDDDVSTCALDALRKRMSPTFRKLLASPFVGDDAAQAQCNFRVLNEGSLRVTVVLAVIIVISLVVSVLLFIFFIVGLFSKTGIT